MKFGREASAEEFASRVIWALGYHEDTLYYVCAGTIRPLGTLKRSQAFINKREGSAKPDSSTGSVVSVHVGRDLDMGEESPSSDPR